MWKSGFSQWRTLLQRRIAQRIRRVRRRPTHGSSTAAMIEILENRQLLSALTVVGAEQQVNTFIDGDQRTFPESSPAVAVDADGNYVVTWSSYGQDGNSYGVYAQRFDAVGNALGSEFRVNTTTQSSQQWSSVSMNDSGEFIITWTSYGRDGSGWGIYAQRYDAAGNAVGGEFLVNTTTFHNQQFSSVSMNNSGEFVVTWISYGQDGGSTWDVYGQRFDAAGNTVGSEFRVNTTVADYQIHPSVSLSDSGRFVVTWTSGAQDGSGYGVYGQRYDATGNAVGGEFRVNTTTFHHQQWSSVSMNDSDQFVVTWSSNEQDGSGYGVYGQRYDAAGNAVGSEFRVNTATFHQQRWSSVSLNDAGEFVVTWTSGAQDGSGDGIYAQRYDAAGNAVGSEFLVNTTTADHQQSSSVALNDSGQFVIAWTSFAQDGSGAGVYAQRYATSSANQPPSANGGGPYVVDEGAAIALDASESSDPDEATGELTFEWDLNYDGVTFDVDATGIAPAVSFPDDFATRTIAVRVTDSQGASDIATTTLTVNNAVPMVDEATFDVVENSANGTVVGTVTASDPGADVLTYAIAESDVPGAFAINSTTGEITVADSTKLDFETYPMIELLVTATDDDGATGSANITVNLLNQASITGTVFVDVNENGLYEANEMGIDGVTVELLDQDGTVVRSTVTADGGFYLFEDMDPGVYQIHEIQPSGVDDGPEILGDLGGTVVANDRMELTLGRDDGSDYVFAEFGQLVSNGDAAPIGFWQNKHGQDLIAQGGTDLAQWLTSNFGNVFGDAFAGADGTDIAAFYKDQLFKQKANHSAGPAKVDAQFMATAFATFFTSHYLAGNTASAFGFNVTDTGIGTKIVVNVGTSGAAFGVGDYETLTIFQLLKATDQLTDLPDNESGFAKIYDQDGDGVIDEWEATLRIMANGIYSAINEQGEI